MKESLKMKIYRAFVNITPAYRGTGARVTYISDGFRNVKIRLPLNWRTRNVSGTIFGGSIYASADPVYMLMLIKILGPGYIVWDKAANIKFLKPGRTTLRAEFKISDEEIETIKKLLETSVSIDRYYLVEMIDESGTVCASIEKTVYIKKKENHK